MAVSLKRITKPKASVSISLSKDVISLGEELTGTLHVTSEEEFDADEVRVEVWGSSDVLSLGGQYEFLTIRTFIRALQDPRLEPFGGQSHDVSNLWFISERIFPPPYLGTLHLTRGYERDFPFSINIPATSRFLKIRWKVKGVIGVKKRRDITSKEIIFEVSIPSSTESSRPYHDEEAIIQGCYCPICGRPIEDDLRFCPHCGTSIQRRLAE